MRDVVMASGWLLAPIALCSLVALGLTLERWLFFAGIRRRDRQLAERVDPMLGRGELDEAHRECAAAASPLGRVLLVGLDARGLPPEAGDALVSVAIEEELLGAERGLRGLATVGRIAPLLGLLGTVAGLIRSFMAFGIDAARPNPALLAEGIWQALVTTVAGLVVAIPAIVAHEWFAMRVDRLAFALRAAAVRLLASVRARTP